MTAITSIADLEALYPDAPVPASTVKVTTHITADYARLIAASPFVVLATIGPEGLDCSPRGDRVSVVRVDGPRTLTMPDRRGNNRIDSLRNIVRDPRVALLFLIPGSGTTLRVNGLARVSADRALLDSFAINGARPRSVIVIETQEVYFQCARAVVRSGLWSAEAQAAAEGLPTPGAILANLSDGAVGGEGYDREWPERAAATLW